MTAGDYDHPERRTTQGREKGGPEDRRADDTWGARRCERCSLIHGAKGCGR